MRTHLLTVLVQDHCYSDFLEQTVFNKVYHQSCVDVEEHLVWDKAVYATDAISQGVQLSSQPWSMMWACLCFCLASASALCCPACVSLACKLAGLFVCLAVLAMCLRKLPRSVRLKFLQLFAKYRAHETNSKLTWLVLGKDLLVCSHKAEQLTALWGL